MTLDCIRREKESSRRKLKLKAENGPQELMGETVDVNFGKKELLITMSGGGQLIVEYGTGQAYFNGKGGTKCAFDNIEAIVAEITAVGGQTISNDTATKNQTSKSDSALTKQSVEYVTLNCIGKNDDSK